ncbi:MAG: hypothetical protein FWC39_00925 [Bacteroidetes bacterium]|nr:hypothetical protein [Bacteroidota bacterium]
MKTNIFIISAFLLIFAGSFSACKEKEDIRKVYSIKEGRFYLNENEFVTMQILPEEGTNNSSHILRIENHSEKDLLHGYGFSLEYLNKNKWDSIQLPGWNLVGHILFSGKTTEEKIYLLPLIKEYNSNKKGQYRLTKNFTLYGDFHFEDVSGDIKLSTEFEIK